MLKRVIKGTAEQPAPQPRPRPQDKVRAQMLRIEELEPRLAPAGGRSLR